MFLKEDQLLIKIKGAPFQSWNTPAPSMILDPTAISGWYDGVAMDRSTTQRALGWGDFLEKATPSSRLITVTGTAVAETPLQLHAMRDAFIGMLTDGEYVEMSVESSYLDPRYATVGLASKPSFVRITDTAASWKLELYAPDPRVYGVQKQITITDREFTGGLKYPLTYPLNYGVSGKFALQTLDNDGNVESFPTFVVKGSFLYGFTITDGKGHTLVYSGAVTPSAPVTINSAKGTASSNGIDRSTFLTRREWFSIPPLQPITPIFDPVQTGSGWCDILWRDTWI